MVKGLCMKVKILGRPPPKKRGGKVPPLKHTAKLIHILHAILYIKMILRPVASPKGKVLD